MDAESIPRSPSSPRPRLRDQPHAAPLLLIGAFKLVKAGLLVALGVLALRVAPDDVAARASRWIEWLHLDPGNRHIEELLSKIAGLDDHRLREIGIVSFLYAALFLTEGVGLCLHKRWAEYMTTVLTASALPFEIISIMNRVTAPRIVLLLANVAILIYLITILRHDRRKAKHIAAEPSADAGN